MKYRFYYWIVAWAELVRAIVAIFTFGKVWLSWDMAMLVWIVEQQSND